MVRFHSINKVMAAGAILLFISLITLTTDRILLSYPLFYGRFITGSKLAGFNSGQMKYSTIRSRENKV